MNNLSKLPEYIIKELVDFSSLPNYVTASEFLVAHHDGVQVSVKFERDEDEFMVSKPIFNMGNDDITSLGIRVKGNEE